MAISPNERNSDLELLKFRLLTDMQGELTAWAKRRFSIFAIVIAVVGTFGFTTVLTQIIQGLVASNVKSSVDREIDNSKSAINRELEYARKIVDEQLSRLDRNFDRTATRLDSAIERATNKEVILENATTEAQKAAVEARNSADSAIDQLEETKGAIESASQEARRLKNEYESLRNNYGKFGEDLYLRVSKSESMFARNQKQLEILQNQLHSIDTAILNALTTLSQNDVKINAIAASYLQSKDTFAESRSNPIETFDDNGRFKVVIFAQKGKGLAEPAEVLASTLRSEGFESEVWITDSEEQLGALSNISAYFGGLDEVIQRHSSGFIYRDNDEHRIHVIMGVLEGHADYHNLVPTHVDFSPNEVVSKNMRGEVLAPSNIYLIYKTTE